MAAPRARGAAGGAGDRRGRPGEETRRRIRDEEREPARGGRRADRDQRFARGARDEGPQAPKTWGSLARKSVRELRSDDAPGGARKAWRDAVANARDEERRWEPAEVWIEEGRVDDDRPARRSGGPAGGRRAGAAGAASRGVAARGKAARGPAGKREAPTGGSSVRRKSLPRDVVNEVGEAVPGAKAARYQERLGEAAKAYERDRYRDALRLLKPLAEMMPGASAVRELYGLSLYRLGRWNDAIRELEAYRALEPASYDQHPTLADCYRAKKRWREVAELWEDLRQASPTAELVAEGRIVMAGALGDQGKLAEAIDLLEKAKTDNRRPRPHHLRIWYALADLYERAGEIPRARELFRRVVEVDPDLYDARDRLAGIG